VKTAHGVWLCLSLWATAVCGQTLKPLVKLEAPRSMDSAVVCDGGGSIVGVGGGHDVYSWSLPSGARQMIKVTDGNISWHGVACNRKALALGFKSGTGQVFDQSGIERRRIELKDEVAAIAVSADGGLLAVATIHSPVQLWDLTNGKLLWWGSTDFGNTTAIEIVPEGNLIIAADTDTRIRAYDWNGKLVYSADSGLLEPFGLGLSADGKKFAVGGMEGAIELYDSATGKRLKESESSGNTIWGIMMAPAGTKVLALELDDGYRMDQVAIGYWDTSGRELKKLAVDPRTVIGFGRSTVQPLLVRQEASGKISVDSVE
jgi:WD40 repeat protein